MRLTKALREDIVNSVIADTNFKEKFKVIEDEQQVIIRDIASYSYVGLPTEKEKVDVSLNNIEKQVKKHIDKYGSYGLTRETFIVKDTEIYLTIGTNRYGHIPFLQNGDREYLRTSSSVHLKPSNKNAIRFIENDNKKTKLISEKATLHNQLINMLNTVTTTKKLLEIWPEGAKYIPDTQSSTAKLPIPLVADINNLVNKYKTTEVT